MAAETFSNRGPAVLNRLRFDGRCLMVAEMLGRHMTVLLSSLMEGIYCRFIPFMDIWMMGRGFLLIEAGELGLW